MLYNFFILPLYEIIFIDLILSPKEANNFDESLPITFADIAPPTLICSPPGTEYRVKFFFFKKYIRSEILAPDSTSISLSFLFILIILFNFFNEIIIPFFSSAIDLLS